MDCPFTIRFVKISENSCKDQQDFYKTLFHSFKVERYDPRTDTWAVVKPMLTRRCRLGVATLNGKLYVCGGYDGSTFLQSVEVYDAKTDT